MKKIIAIIMVICLTITSVSVLADISVNMEYPVVDEKVEMSMVLLKGAASADPNEIWFWKYFEGLSNVHWNITEIDSSIWNEKKAVLLASDDYPDVFWGPQFTSTEIMRYGADGIFIPLNNLIEKYAPNCKALLDSTEGARNGLTCPDGNIYSMPYFTPGATYSDYRAWINTQWLKNLNLEMPTTLDEFYDVLLAFKENDANLNGDPNDEVPWGGTFVNTTAADSGRLTILSALGFINNDGQNTAIKDGKACFMPLHEDYRKYLEFANKCWKAGLMDPDIFTQTTAQNKAKLAGEVHTGYMAGGLGGITDEQYVQFEHVVPLTSDVNDTRIWYQSEHFGGGSMFITDACKTPEVAIRWMDMLYDPNYAMLFQNGPIYGTDSDPDGIGWIPESGTTEPVGLKEKNPENLGWWDYLCAYMVPRNRGGQWFATIDDYYALDQATAIEFKRDQGGLEGYWRESNYKNASEYFTSGYPNTVFYSDEDAETLRELTTPLNDYVAQMEAKFITGAESFDNYNAFIDELIKRGADKVDAIYAKTYEALVSK